MKEINLQKAGEEIMRNKNNPAGLDHIQLNLAGYYAFYSDKMIELELKKAIFWEENKNFNSEKPKSDPLVRALWMITKDGHKMIEIERTLSTIHIYLGLAYRLNIPTWSFQRLPHIFSLFL